MHVIHYDAENANDILIVKGRDGRQWSVRALASENLPQMLDVTSYIKAGDLSTVHQWVIGEWAPTKESVDG